MVSQTRMGKAALILGVVTAIGLVILARILIPGNPRVLPSGHYPPQFPISKGTTAIIEPLDEEGYPDYERAANLQLGKGIEPEKNRVVALFEILGPKPEGKAIPAEFFRGLQMTPPPGEGVYLMSFAEFLKSDPTVDKDRIYGITWKEMNPAMNRPWKATEFPRVARWLKAHEAMLGKLHEASRRPQFFFPLIHLRPINGPDDFLKAYLPTTDCFRPIGDLLLCRTWLRVEEGNFEGAKDDLMACFRIFRRNPVGGTLDSMLCLSMDLRFLKTASVLLQYLPFTRSQLDEWKREFDALPSLHSLADLADSYERYEVLQQVIQFSRLGDKLKPWTQMMVLIGNELVEKIEKEMGFSLLDWNDCLKTINYGMDQIVASQRLESDSVREAELKKLQEMWEELRWSRLEELAASPSVPWKRTDAKKLRSQLLAAVYLHTYAGVSSHMQAAWDRDHEYRGQLEISLGLAMFRREKGEYPEDLSALVPAYLKTVPDDIYSGGPHPYQKTSDGYRLYSVGPNRIDDGGAMSPYAEPPGDDIVVCVPTRPMALNHPVDD